MTNDPGRPVRDVLMDCHGRREIAIAEQKAHQNQIAKLLFVAQPMLSLLDRPEFIGDSAGGQRNTLGSQYCWCIFCLLAFSLLGCGKQPANTTGSEGLDAKANPASAASELAPTGPATSQPATKVGVAQDAADTVSSTATNSQELGQSSSETPAAKAPPTVASTVFAPTEAQLARWKQTEYEPLELTARHVPRGISFAAHAESSSNGEWLVVGGDKLTLWQDLGEKPVATLWDLKTSQESESIKSLAIDPSGTWLAAGDAIGTIRIWNLSDQKEIATKRIGTSALTQIAISDDGKEIATATYGKEIHIWNAVSLERKKKFEVETSGLAKLTYAAPGKLAVAGQSLTIWDTSSGMLDKTLLETGYVTSMVRSADLSLFAFAEEKRFRLLRSSDLSESGEIKGEFARNEILKLTTDGKFLWTANGSNIRCWERATGRIVRFIDVTEPEVIGLEWLDKSNVLRVVTEDGIMRYWSIRAIIKAAVLNPLRPQIEPEDSNDVPATDVQLRSIVDLRVLPQPPNSDAVGGNLTMVQFQTGNSIEDSKSFYRHIFAQRGWKELPGNVHTPNYLTFNKQGFRVFVNIAEATAGKNSIYLTSLGNVDLRTLPKLDLPGFKISYEDVSNVNYELGSDLLTIETELLKKLSAAGWLPYARLNSSHSEQVDSRDLEFIRNAMTLRVSIQRKRDDPSKYYVQYSTFVADGHLPVPKDCDFIECDAAHPPALVVRTSLSLDDCQAFYDQEMVKLGWMVWGYSKSTEDNFRSLAYFRDQDELKIRISVAEEGGTWVVVGKYAQQNSWQLAKKEEPKQDDNKPAKPGIEAADIPIYKQAEATAVTYDDRQKRIEIKVPKNSHIEIVDFYAAKLTELGWKEEPNGFRAEDYAFVTFTKDKASIQVRVNSNSLGTTIGISDDGLLWNKAPSEAKVLISYAGWLRKNRHPATLRLLDDYIQAMRAN